MIYKDFKVTATYEKATRQLTLEATVDMAFTTDAEPSSRLPTQAVHGRLRTPPTPARTQCGTPCWYSLPGSSPANQPQNAESPATAGLPDTRPRGFEPLTFGSVGVGGVFGGVRWGAVLVEGAGDSGGAPT